MTMMMMVRPHHRRLAPLLSRSTLYCSRHLPNTARYLTTNNNYNNNGDGHHDDFREQMKELQEERELLFGFTKEETMAWQQQGSSPLETSHVEAMNLARIRHYEAMDQRQQRQEEEQQQEQQQEELQQQNDVDERNDRMIVADDPQHPFTHVSMDGADISMVDVGQKQVTQRIARARTTVVFPPEVMSAFQFVSTNSNNSSSSSSSSSTKNELVGPKGPIFATAKLAGIMAAKKTSDLIPLCHPLPLDRVHVDITLVDHIATIECECRVTHKTGVEMEALTGATIAALTIYDMVKAVSHNVEISQTILVSKSGGKRTIIPPTK